MVAERNRAASTGGPEANKSPGVTTDSSEGESVGSGTAQISKPIGMFIAHSPSVGSSPLKDNRDVKTLTESGHVPEAIMDNIHHDPITDLEQTTEVVQDSEGVRDESNL